MLSSAMLEIMNVAPPIKSERGKTMVADSVKHKALYVAEICPSFYVRLDTEGIKNELQVG